MKVILVDPKEKKFLARNGRVYSLKRKVRRAPEPYVFGSKGKAEDAIRLNAMDNFVCVAPGAVKQSAPRQVSVRRYTCGGRR
jgi:hypothetical protein